MRIAYAVTRTWYGKFLPSLRSLTEHNDADVIVLAEDDKLPIDVPVINVSKQDWFNGLNANTVFSYMSLMRLVLADLIKDDRILYLDADTIVLDSLLPIWETDMEGKWWGAVPEYYGNWKPYGPRYYNAGVSLYNLAQMRKDHAVEQLVQELNTNQLLYPDQDAMNKLCIPDRVVPLPVRYNECFCCGQTHNPAIVHYAGYGRWWEGFAPRAEYMWKYR